MIKEKLPFKPKKSFGQNFLFNESYLRKIVDSFNLKEDSIVVEIGPGYGSLSEIIKDQCKLLVCIEKDRNLYSFLTTKFSNQKNVIVVLGDVLSFDWKTSLNEIFEKNKIDKKSLPVVVGNLPYNISNDLLVKLLESRFFFEKFVFLVQKEVSRRLIATSSEYKSSYSSFSIFINYYCKTELIFDISRSFFQPEPKVDGSLVLFQFNHRIETINETSFFTFVKNCFRSRRKTLLNNLKKFCWKEKKQIIEILDIISKKKDKLSSILIRPQDLSLEDYLLLFSKIFSS